MPTDPRTRRAIATMAALKRHGADGTRITVAQTELDAAVRSAAADAAIRRLVDSAPALTAEQIDRIRAIVGGAS